MIGNATDAFRNTHTAYYFSGSLVVTNSVSFITILITIRITASVITGIHNFVHRLL